MQRYSPGLGGFARQAQQDLEAYWLENMVIDRDGTYRPRWGLEWLTTLPASIVHMSRLGGYNARIMVVANGTLNNIHVESLSTTSVDTGWPSVPFTSAIGVTTSGSNVWIACKAGTGVTPGGTLYKYDGSSLSAISSPSVGNGVGMHGYFAVKVYSGQTNNTALRWSNLGDVDTWQVTSAKQPPPEIGTVDAIIPFSQRESILFGPSGVASMKGTAVDSMSFEVVANLPVVTPMYHIARCKDAVYFLAPGPQICRYRHPGIVERIDAPLHRLLYDASGSGNLRAWYDPQRNLYVLWDNTTYTGYLFSIDQQRWIGAQTYGTASTNMYGHAEVDQGASTIDQAEMPWGLGFTSAGARLLRWNPTLYVDETGSGTSTAFNCRVETKPSFGGMDPTIEKQCPWVHVYGTGSWTVKLKSRSGPDATYTTTTLGTVTAPGRIYPSLANMPAYTERTFLCEATSSSGVRWASIACEEVPVGEPT